MPDARFPDRWLTDRRVVRLTDQDFRSFVVALAWSVSNRTDGRIEAADLPLIVGFRQESLSGLAAAGLWVQQHADWCIADFDATQSSKAQLDGLDHRRHQDRERKARQRARERGAEPSSSPSRDSPRDVTRDIGSDTKARPGQARTGSSECLSVEDEQVDERTGEVAGWPPVAVQGIPKPAQHWCTASGCRTKLVGVEVSWGLCADHHRMNVA